MIHKTHVYSRKNDGNRSARWKTINKFTNYVFTKNLVNGTTKQPKITKREGKNVGEWYNQTATNCKKERRKMWVSGTAKQPQIAKKREEKCG